MLISAELPKHRTEASRSHALTSLLKVSAEDTHTLQSEEPLERYFYEEYVEDRSAWKRRAYYALKPLIPRALQLFLRQRYASAQGKSQSTAWPIETRALDLVSRSVDGALQTCAGRPLFALSPWPRGTNFAFCITHDVEWDSGLRHALRLLEVERRVGMVSSWNLVPERYPIDWGIVNELRSAGGEIGIHGLKHDGRLFQSKSIFLSRLEKIARYAEEWGAVGFRSPSCLRNARWMEVMSFEYDSSFPDTDPYEPQPGGCCSPWPFFLGSMVELPLTMPQDHTLYEILGHRNLDLWDRKVAWLQQVSGVVVINVHPDYVFSGQRLQQYEDFLMRMKHRERMWHALPREIARWWRDRDASTLVVRDRVPEIVGPVADRGAIATLTLEDDMFRFESVA